MNPVDHPHGGGEGRAPIGRSRPVSPWGKPALGSKTRKRKKLEYYKLNSVQKLFIIIKNTSLNVIYLNRFGCVEKHFQLKYQL